MSLLALLAANRAPSPPDTLPPGFIEGDTTPTLPTSAPWNGVPMEIPTPDGSGQTVHPSVVDFGAPWNGWRFWMAITPYPGFQEALENPSIVVSHDGFTWAVPEGGSNPIYPWQGVVDEYNSDTELVWDAEGQRLICYWRAFSNATRKGNILAKASGDGINWGPVVEVLPTADFLSNLSPSVIRRGPGDWWMFLVNRTGAAASQGFSVKRSVDPLAGWGPSQNVYSGSPDPWHAGVLWDGEAFRALICDWRAPAPIRAASSRDGLIWVGTDPIIETRPGAWDEAKLYRPYMTIQDKDWYRVWYSSVTNGGGWATGRTQLPASIFPAV